MPATGGAAAVLALIPVSAQAAPFQGGNYGAYGMEGQYPTVSSCAGTFGQVGPTRSAEGMALKYFYNTCDGHALAETGRH